MAGVYDFDEEDDDLEPFPRKPAFSKNPAHISRPVKDAKQKGFSTACSKDRVKKISLKNGDKKIDTKCSFELHGLVQEGSRCNSLLHGGAMENRLSEVLVSGEGLWFAKGMIQVHRLECTFMTNSIALKILDGHHNFIAIDWSLNEITGFSFRTCIQTSDDILELNLTESAMKLLEHKLEGALNNSDLLYDRDFTLATQIKSVNQSDPERKITCLSDHYKALWRPEEMKRYKQRSMKQHPLEWKCCEKHNSYEGESNERVTSKGLEANMTTWFDLTYPRGDPDAVMVTVDDFLLLNPHEFVSDTIIDFYIKFLQSTLLERQKKRLYFFNSFFFRKLAKLDRDNANDLVKTNSVFQPMKRWTRDINIFEKDFLFIPIMQRAHWSLIIVCYPGHLFNYEYQKTGGYKKTLILHFDSMEGSHKGVEQLIEKYLVEHWSDSLSKGMPRDEKSCSVRCVRAKVPQQTNYVDCGLFMLHYVEMFLKALQSELSTIQVSRKWFNPEDVASKRSMLQSLIKKMQEEELSERVVLRDVDALCEEPLNVVAMQGASVVPKMDASGDEIFEVDGESTQKIHRCSHAGFLQDTVACHEQEDSTEHSASHEPVYCQSPHAVCGSQLSKASQDCRPGAANNVFDEDSARELSNSFLLENQHLRHLSGGKDEKHMHNIYEDIDVSRKRMYNEKQSEGSAADVKQSKNNRIDMVHVSIHTEEAAPQIYGYVSDEGEESYHLTCCDQGATQVSRLKCLPCKEQQSLPQMDNHKASLGMGLEDCYVSTCHPSEATRSKSNSVSKRDNEQAEEHSHHNRGPALKSQQILRFADPLYIPSSDEETGYVKVKKIVEASKLRHQNRQRKAASSKATPRPVASNASKGIENQPPNVRWRLRRRSQLLFL